MAASGKRLWSPTKGKGAAPHRPTLMSSVMAALLAVGVVMGFVVLRTGMSATSGQRSSSTTSVPSLRVPPAVVPTPMTTPATAPPTTATTRAAAPATPAVPTTCTLDDLRVTTEATGRPSGGVALTTRLEVLRTCVFDPAAVPPYSCADTIVVNTVGGSQAWPGGDGEQCHALSAGTLPAGTVDTLEAVWANPPAGNYRAVGSWGWSAGAGSAPQQASMPSAPFTVS